MADFADKLAGLIEATAGENGKPISQSELSRRSGVPQTSISGYILKKNKPSWEHVQKLAAALGAKCEDLTDDPAPPAKGKTKRKPPA